LLGVAVARARALGQGGSVVKSVFGTWYLGPHLGSLAEIRGGLVVANVYLKIGFESKLIGEIRVLAPELADAHNVVLKVLDRLRGVARKAGRATPDLDPGLLPVEFRATLKRVAETVIATVLIALYERYMRGKGGEAPVGAVLATCDPSLMRVRVGTDNYTIHYSCKSPRGDVLLVLITNKVKRSVVAEILLLPS
jgi:hypothetical protein